MSSSTASTVVSTNGWDLVLATSYANLNSQITTQWNSLVSQNSGLDSMSASMAEDSSISIELTTGIWQITTGGAGDLINIELPIINGTYNGIEVQINDQPVSSWALGNTTITIQINLEWIPQGNQINFSITDNVPTIINTLNSDIMTSSIQQVFSQNNVTLSLSAEISTNTSGSIWTITDSVNNTSYYLYTMSISDGEVIEVYQYISNNLMVTSQVPSSGITVVAQNGVSDEMNAPYYSELISQNIASNLKLFNFLFSSVSVLTQLSSQDPWSWLQPTTLSYAVVEPDGGTADSCVFGVLAMANNNTNSNPVQQVDVNAIPSGSAYGLLVSPELFLTNIMLPCTMAVFSGSTSDDFTVNMADLNIQNNTTLTWNQFMVDSEAVTLSVAPNAFSTTLVNDQISLNFTDLSYPVSLAGIDVGTTNINFNAYFGLGLQQGTTTGNQSLWWTITPNQPGPISASTSMDQSFFTVEIIAGLLMIALCGCGLGASVAEAQATDAAANAIEEGGLVTAESTPEEVEEALENLIGYSPSKQQAFIGEASLGQLDILQQGAVELKNANFWCSVASFALKGMVLTGILTATELVLE